MKTIKKKSLLEENPEIAAEWHPTLNSFKPDEITAGSGKKAYFVCKSCGYGKDGEWYAIIAKRTTADKRGCPACMGQAIYKGVNDLKTLYPSIAEEWHPTLNSFKPDEITAGSGKKAYFVCKSCGYGKDGEWYATIAKRTTVNKRGCPACAGKAVYKGVNDLKTLSPLLTEEWHPTLNSFKPDEVTIGSSKKAYFVCKSCGYGKNGEWHKTINSRTNRNINCPACVGKAVYKGVNDLKTLSPLIAEEWHPTLNSFKPDEITAGSAKKAYFVCKSCGYGKDGEWYAAICSRVGGKKICPACGLSKGELAIRDFLHRYNIEYKGQYKDKKCTYIRILSFDFAIIKNRKVIFLIEYDGEQHFRPVCFGGISKEQAKINFKEIKKRDKIKTQYCKKNNIPLLRISYTDFDRIEEILSEEFPKYGISI